MGAERAVKGTGDELRLAELLAALSLAADLGLGQPMEHVMRSCLIAVRLGERVGADPEERAATYYVALLAWMGCNADSHELAALFGDDIAFRADSYEVDLAGLPLMAFMLRHVGSGRPALQRARLTAALVATAGRAAATSMLAHCQVAAALAERLGLGPQVHLPLLQVFARWDGKGLPAGLRGEAIALPIRLAQLADIVEAHRRTRGPEAALEVARRRSGTQFDPGLVDAFCRHAPELLAGLEAETSHDAVIAAEPALARPLAAAEVDPALEAIADFADLKSPFFAGHSRAVADLAAEATRLLGLPAGDVLATRRAGLLHDLGRAGVPNTIWDKPGPLTRGEWERVRLHPHYTDRIIARLPSLAGLRDAAAPHERLDGSGYHRGLSGAALGPPARALAAADAYRAMIEPRPHRPALPPERAAAELRSEARAGRLDAQAVDAVLTAAGHAVTRRARAAPAGLTAREIEVLRLLARGASNRDIARALVIVEKTAANHVQNLYAKIGVSTRAAAALFAMRHGLVDPADPTGR